MLLGSPVLDPFACVYDNKVLFDPQATGNEKKQMTARFRRQWIKTALINIGEMEVLLKINADRLKYFNYI